MFQSDLHSVMMLARQRQAELHEAAAPGHLPRPDRMASNAARAHTSSTTATAPVMRAWLQAVAGGRRTSEAA